MRFALGCGRVADHGAAACYGVRRVWIGEGVCQHGSVCHVQLGNCRDQLVQYRRHGPVEGRHAPALADSAVEQPEQPMQHSGGDRPAPQYDGGGLSERDLGCDQRMGLGAALPQHVFDAVTAHAPVGPHGAPARTPPGGAPPHDSRRAAPRCGILITRRAGARPCDRRPPPAAPRRAGMGAGPHDGL